MLVAVFGDAHAHAEALDAVIDAAERHGVQELWSLGDMIGAGPDPGHVVSRTPARRAPSRAISRTACARPRTLTLDGVGHLPNLERPERFDAELWDFLAAVAPT